MRLIDADKLKEELSYKSPAPDFDIDSVILGVIDEQPTIDAVEVVHGKWNPGKILSREFVGNVCVSIDFEDWRCSICGIVVEQPNMPLYKYCPNCGTKMDGGKDDI